MRKVYVIQKQMIWEPKTGELKPKFDLSPAAKYGELVFLLSPTAGPFNSESIIKELHEKLSKFTEKDYLLLVGNPCLIGWTAAVAASKTGGKVHFLQWSARDGEYVGILANIFP